jgi:hypothetical protein
MASVRLLGRAYWQGKALAWVRKVMIGELRWERVHGCCVAQRVEHLLRRSARRVGLFLALSVLPVSGTLAQSDFGVRAPTPLAKPAQCSWYWLVQP